MIEELIPLVDDTKTIALQNELKALYGRELFEKQIYFLQLRKFEGLILEVLKEISEQEEKHSEILRNILNKAGIQVIDAYDAVPIQKATSPLKEALQYDIGQEEISAGIYNNAIAKTDDENLKKILMHILEEEFNHVGILKRQLEK